MRARDAAALVVQRSLRVGSGSGAARAVAGVAAVARSSTIAAMLAQRAERAGAKLERASADKDTSAQRSVREGLSLGRLPVGRLVFMRPTPSAAIPQLPLAAKASPSLNASNR